MLTPAVPDPKITMSPGATYSFDVKFVPGMTPGDYSTEITIISTDPDSPLVIPVRALAGPPQAKVAYSSLLLPDVPTGVMGMPMDVNITNEGNSDLQVLGITADKTDFVIPNAPTAMMYADIDMKLVYFNPESESALGKLGVAQDKLPTDLSVAKDVLQARIRADISEAVWRGADHPATVGVKLIAPELFDQEPVHELDGLSLDRLDIECTRYTPAPELLRSATDEQPVSAMLSATVAIPARAQAVVVGFLTNYSFLLGGNGS